MTYSNPEIPTRGAVGSGRGGPATIASGSQRIPPQTEKQFQAAVVELARALGYLTYHTFNSQRSNPGFPDLVMVKPPRVIFMECKKKGGRATLAQRVWITALRRTPVEAYFVWPDNWEFIVAVLQGTRSAGAWPTDIELKDDDAPPIAMESC